MTVSKDHTYYGPVSKTLHWTAALCVLLAWLIGSIGERFVNVLDGMGQRAVRSPWRRNMK